MKSMLDPPSYSMTLQSLINSKVHYYSLKTLKTGIDWSGKVQLTTQHGQSLRDRK